MRPKPIFIGKKRLNCPSCGEVESLEKEGDRCVFCGVQSSQPRNSTELSTTVDQWQEALGAANQDDPGETISEISKRSGLAADTVRTRIQKLVRQGACKSGTARRADSLGRKQLVTVYQLVEK